MSFLDDLDDLPGRPVRVSGSIDLDMSKVVEESARRAAEVVMGQIAPAMARSQEAILQAVMAALAQILETVKQARVVLDPVEAQRALDQAVPRGYLYHGAGEPVNPVHLAQQLQIELARAGYGLVPISPQTVDTRVSRAPVEDERVTRADARLKLARDCGQDDSWYEQGQQSQ